MDSYGMDNDQGSMGGFFEFNKKMNEITKCNNSWNQNSSLKVQKPSESETLNKYNNTWNQNSSFKVQKTSENENLNKCTFFQTGVPCVFHGCKCKSYHVEGRRYIEPARSEGINQRHNAVSSTNVIPGNAVCTYGQDGKSCMRSTCKHCCPKQEKLPSVSPVRDEKSVTPVRDEPAFTEVPNPLLFPDASNDFDNDRLTP